MSTPKIAKLTLTRCPGSCRGKYLLREGSKLCHKCDLAAPKQRGLWILANSILDMSLEPKHFLPVSRLGFVWCDNSTVLTSLHHISTTHLSGLDERLKYPPRVSISTTGIIFTVLRTITNEFGIKYLPRVKFGIQGLRDGRILTINLQYTWGVEDEFGVFLDQRGYEFPYTPTVYPLVGYPNIYAVY